MQVDKASMETTQTAEQAAKHAPAKSQSTAQQLLTVRAHALTTDSHIWHLDSCTLEVHFMTQKS